MSRADPILDPAVPGDGGPVLQVEDLEVSFPSEQGRVQAVRELSYRVDAGEVLGIVGESGSGKSVSSMAVMGLLPPQARVSGSIRFRGTELLGKPDTELSRIRGRRVAMIFQDPLSALTPVYTVGQVAEAVLAHGTVPKNAAARRAVELLDLVGIPNPEQRARSFPHEFSGGMRQRVVIAMAIANDPDVIIADEPTTALDVTVQAQVLEVLEKAKEITGAAIVLITHDLGVVAGIADRVMVMYGGRAVETGDTDDVYAHPRMPYTVGLLGSVPRVDTGGRQPLAPIEGQPPSMVDPPAGCPFVPRCPMAVDLCGERGPELLALDGVAGRAAACHRSGEIDDSRAVFAPGQVHQPTAPGRREHRQTLLRVTDLVKQYPVTAGVVLRRRIGTVHAVDRISFDIREGETLGLVGESGCGKSTTLMEVLNLERPMGGWIEVLGRDAGTLRSRGRKAVRRDLQVVFQDPIGSLDPRLPISGTLAEPMTAHGFDADHIRGRVPELLRLVGLRPEVASRYPAEFSGGQRQRIAIARALALEPKVLVLDEPVSALDVSIQAGVINLLEELQQRLELAYLFVAHDLSVIRHIADRVAVMYLGKIVEIGAADAVFGAPLHPYQHLDGSLADNNDVMAALMPTAWVIQPDGTATVNKNYMESVELTSTDPQVVTYTINPEATWSDDTPITWEDIRSQWQALNGSNPAFEVSSTTGYENIVSVERGVDDRQAVVTFDPKFADWKSLFTQNDLLYPKSTTSNPQMFNEGWTQEPQVTAGPFKVGQVDQTAQTITLVRNENWWGPTPRLDRIIYRVVDLDAQPNSYANGEIDFFDVASDVNKFTRAQQIPNTEVRKSVAPDMRHITFNGAEGSILANRELRIAIQKGINRHAIAEAMLGRILSDPQPLGNHIFRAGQRGFQRNDQVVSYDPQAASRMLDELGWTRQGDGIRTRNGERLVIRDVIPTGVASSEQEAKIARQQLQQIGVELQIVTVPVSDFFEKHVNVGDFDVTHFSWLGTAFPVSSTGSIYQLTQDTQQNYGRIGNETINRLYAEANRTLDEQRKLQLANQIDTEVWKSGHSLLLYARPDIQAVRSDVANFGAFGFADEVYTDIGFVR